MLIRAHLGSGVVLFLVWVHIGSELTIIGSGIWLGHLCPFLIQEIICEMNLHLNPEILSNISAGIFTHMKCKWQWVAPLCLAKICRSGFKSHICLDYDAGSVSAVLVVDNVTLLTHSSTDLGIGEASLSKSVFPVCECQGLQSALSWPSQGVHHSECTYSCGALVASFWMMVSGKQGWLLRTLWLL